MRTLTLLILLLSSINCAAQTNNSIPSDFEYKGCCYRIVDENQKIVELSCSNGQHSDSTLFVPSTVKHDGKRYKVRSIGDYAFVNCMWLKELSIGRYVNTIGVASFSGCKNLKDVHFGNVEMISDEAFNNCVQLNNPLFPANLRYIGNNAFWGNRFSIVRIPDKVIIIGEEAFGNNPVRLLSSEALTLLYGVSEVPTGTLCELHLGANVLVIGEGAFKESILDDVVIPANVKFIGKDAFLTSHSIGSFKLLPSIPPIIGSSVNNFDVAWSFIKQDKISTTKLYVNKKNRAMYSNNTTQEIWKKLQIIDY